MTPRLQEIIEPEDLQELMLFFYETSGIAVGVLDLEHNWLVSIGGQKICTNFHRVNPNCRQKCLLTETRILEYLDANDYTTHFCQNGLIEVIVPILLDDVPLGYFFLGQFLYQQPDRDYFKRQAITYGFDINDYLLALDQVPIVSPQHIDYLMRFFVRFFGLLTRLGGENKQRCRAELEIIKAKEQLEVRVEERTEELNKALNEVGDLAAQLNEKLHQIEQLAVIDSLTNTYNRRKFDEVITNEHNRTEKNKVPFSFIMLDIDHFKMVNDKFGHSVGDQVLKHLCHLIRSMIRQGDLLIRWGGEEFLLLLPATDIAAASSIAENIRLKVEVEEFETAGNISISLGVAQLQQGDSTDTLLKQVDCALYQAKRDGRNRVVCSS